MIKELQQKLDPEPSSDTDKDPDEDWVLAWTPVIMIAVLLVIISAATMLAR